MKLLGQDLNVLHNQLTALIQNILAWSASFVVRKTKAILPPAIDRCVSIPGPGGLDNLQVVPLDGRITVGYNVPGYAPGPFVSREQQDAMAFGPDLVVVNVTHFSVNYADVCIRWGLYESALRYVGWPIVPGFDFSGIVEWAGAESGFQHGDKVFGFTMFGAYTCKLLVPCSQIRKTPIKLSQEDIAGLPAVAATALHAVSLAGAWPQQLVTINKAALIHSAAGGVGSMLIQMCKARGFSPIVAVVGGTHKIQFCLDLGADVVIDKSKSKNLWKEVSAASPKGYAAIFDANGVETISQSYEHLARCGKLVLYGFHSNIPKAQTFLSPWEWVKMIYKIIVMPKFDAMNLVLDSKAVTGFNLSFFAEEKPLIAMYMDQIVSWLEAGAIRPSKVSPFTMNDIGLAHEKIQSGTSVGKLVMRTREE